MRFSPTFLGRFLLILLCLYFSFQLFSVSFPWIFLDNLNLLIHEAGHVLFMPFGQFMHVLGGSLFQVLFPCLFCGYFLQRKDYFSTCFILFWIADNLINVSVYMKDAQFMQLPLLGGDGTIHDWHWLFTQTGLLEKSQIIGQAIFILGALCICISLFGMVLVTFFDVIWGKPVTT